MKLLKIFLCTILYSNAACLMAIEIPNILNLESLSPQLANKAVVAAFDDCTKKGFKVAAALVGRDGNLLAFIRNPLSGPHTIEVSQKKAYTAASLQASTSSMKDRQDLNYAPGILLIVGGVPISVAGKFYGGLAVAGADTDIDEECALAGIKAISDTLQFGE
jgi:uncharacterized protein GlcG (DUF336 family)